MPEPNWSGRTPRRVDFRFNHNDLHGAGAFYLPITGGTLHDGDILLAAGIELTTTFNDTAHPTFHIVGANGNPATDTLTEITGHTEITTTVAASGLLFLADGKTTDQSGFKFFGSFVVQQGQGPVTTYITGDPFAGDGTTGQATARLIIERTP